LVDVLQSGNSEKLSDLDSSFEQKTKKYFFRERKDTNSGDLNLIEEQVVIRIFIFKYTQGG